MHAFPHRYEVTARGTATGDVELSAEGLPTLASQPPAQFDGPGDRWSPETLLVGAIGDCVMLTFRAVARLSNVPWVSLACTVTGTLDRVDRVTRFTAFEVRARLTVPPGADLARARRALEKAKENCLITNSLKADCHLSVDIEVASDVDAARFAGPR
jgi:organic hydroperoxide reductase OsmC/OhrA